MKSHIFTILLLCLTFCMAQKTKYLDVSELNEKLQKHHRLMVDELNTNFAQLISSHRAFEPGDAGDWYASHPEPGQLFSEYLKKKPVRPTKQLTTIYIQMIGKFTEKQKEIVKITSKCMGHYFQLPVKFAKPMSLKVIPKSAQRIHWGNRQLYTKYILYKILKPRRPKDAVAYIAFTSDDLYPHPAWNFVFGQASIKNRVGVWSIFRNGNADGTEKEFLKCLKRTMKTANHELGHIFSIRHCVAFQCAMNGSNSSVESELRPPWLCPGCLQKLQWSIGFDTAKRFKKLESFYKDAGLEEEQVFYKKMTLMQLD